MRVGTRLLMLLSGMVSVGPVFSVALMRASFVLVWPVRLGLNPGFSGRIVRVWWFRVERVAARSPVSRMAKGF